jgi:hypothetical protein
VTDQRRSTATDLNYRRELSLVMIVRRLRRQSRPISGYREIYRTAEPSFFTFGSSSFTLIMFTLWNCKGMTCGF